MKKTNFLRAVTALILVIALLLSITTAVVSADDSARLYRGSYTTADGSYVFYYSDAFFAPSGKAENPQLRSLSVALATTPDKRGGEEEPCTHVLDLLTDMGFDSENAVLQEMDYASRDTIGTVISKKTIGGTPVVAVAMRAVDYDSEWASNLTAGYEGDALGFSVAANTVLGRIRDYLEQNNITSAKLWICGYSRAGAVANLVGREINKDPAAFKTTADDLYVYTFEAPACSADDTVYENIHNVMDDNDLITHVYPAQWSLYLNGVREAIGDPDKTIMAKKFDFFAPGYAADYKEIDQSEFLDEFIDFLTTYLSREKYVDTLQQPVADLCAMFFDKPRSEWPELFAFLQKALESAQADENFMSVIFRVLGDPENPETIQETTDFLLTHLDAAREEMQPPLTDEEYQTMQNVVKPLLEVIAPMIQPDGSYVKTDADGNAETVSLYHFLTFAMNIGEFISGHYFHSSIPNVQAIDSNFDNSAQLTPGDLYENDTRYTYAEMGDQLYRKARELGFTEDEIDRLKNGSDLRLDVEITPLDDADLLLLTMGKLDKSMLSYQLLTVSVNKTVGLDSISAEQTAKITITLPDSVSLSPRYAVVRTDDDKEALQIPSSVQTSANGETQLCFTATGNAVYALAYDGSREIRLGDVDRDADLTIADATHIQRFLANMEAFSEYQKKAADVDKDDDVTVIDVTHIQRHLAGMNSAIDN